MEAGNARDGGDHHAGEQLHGRYITFIEGARRGRQHFEYAQGPAIVAQGRDKNRSDSEAAATGQVDARIAFGVVAEHDFAGAHGFGRDAGISLQAHTEVWSSAPGAGSTDNLVTGAQGDRSAGRAGKMLCALRDGADGWFKIKLGDANVDLFSGVHDSDAGNGMGGVGDAKLAAKSDRWHARVMVRNLENLPVCDPRIGNCAQQVADETVEFRIGDEMSGLLLAKGPAQNTG